MRDQVPVRPAQGARPRPLGSGHESSLHLIATAALLVSLVVALTAISIGIARADNALPRAAHCASTSAR
jgi:hypothetical protein